MIDNVVLAERLLYHEKVEVIQSLQEVYIRELVRRVGVHHEHDVRKLLANSPYQLNILTRLDLYLYPAVSFLQVTIDLLEQSLYARLHANAYSHVHLGIGSPKHLPKRSPFDFRPKPPDRALQRRLGMVVSLNEADPVHEVLRPGDLLAKH